MKLLSLILIICSLTLTACQASIDTPKQVTEKYWQALKNTDMVTAKKLITKQSEQDLNNPLSQPTETNVFLGDVTLDNNQAIVRTMLSINPENHIEFNTYLSLENKQWRVDATRTQVPPSLNEQLSGALQNNLNSMDKALDEGVDMLNEYMQEGSKEMSESLLKGMNKMNDTMREAIEKMKQRRQQQDSPTKPDNDSDSEKGEGLI